MTRLRAVPTGKQEGRPEPDADTARLSDSPSLRIVVTGASGFVGRMLVPRLVAGGADVLVCGRNPDRLKAAFPGLPACGYDTLAETGAGYDLLLHLAVMNTDASADENAFTSINQDFTLTVQRAAQVAGIHRMIYVSSFHALDRRRTSPYSESKRRGAAALRADAAPGSLVVLYLPAVHGDRFAGKLSALNALPRPIGRVAFGALSALRPTVSVQRLAAFVLSDALRGGDDRVLLSDGQTGNLAYTAIMRGIDIAFALVVVVGFWWLLAGLWLAVRFDSPGPGFFRQERIGRRGRRFTCWKFRTMRLGTRQAETHEVSAQSVTRIGAFLRRTKLDELPQVFNILCGQIALIGPRPCLPVQTALVAARERRGVLDLMPGISGLAQVEGIDMSDPERLAARDADYRAMQSVLLDLRLALATATGQGNGDRVTTTAPENAP